jgi:PERQ amino acid-rich with GYF domain-containing protein
MSARKLTLVAVDEFIQMLLSFPVNLDATTLEIISDMVYANSPNLDGRRFAETFALKRKADAGVSTKGRQPTVPAAPPIVVKTAASVLKQPAPSEGLPGNFKVVQPKKKR